jgi:ATP-binding cassette, subfamily B, bacterial
MKGLGRRALLLGSLLPRRQCGMLSLAILVTLVTSVTVNAVPVLLGRLVNALQSCQEHGTIATEWQSLAVFFLGLILVVFVARECLQAARKYLARKVSVSVETDLTVDLLARLLRADLRLFSGEMSGTLQARARHGIEAYVALFRLGLQDLAPALFTAGGAIAYALYVQPLVGVLLMVAIPLTVLIAAWQTRIQKATRLEVRRCEETLGGTLIEQFSGIEYLRAANMHDREIERVAQVAEERRRKEFQQHFRTAQFEALKALNDWLLQTGVITCALLLTLNGRAEIGSTLTLWYLCFNILTPLRDIQRIFDETHKSYLQVEDLLVLLREPADRSFDGDSKAEARGGADLPGCPNRSQTGRSARHSPLFSTRDVVAEYETASGETKQALDGVSLDVNYGEVVGIAGPSGSGKSTLARLLLRLVHPSAGQAFLGGVPLETVSRAELARLVGYVGQEPFLFSGTVAQNIAYGCAKASAADIRLAAQQVGLHDEILGMPDGYAAQVGERGRNLSGGQRQRLALARVLLQGPPVLVLDEATSALDPANERRVLRALTNGDRCRTVVLVAHRPAALQSADRVLVIENGRMVALKRPLDYAARVANSPESL